MARDNISEDRDYDKFWSDDDLSKPTYMAKERWRAISREFHRLENVSGIVDAGCGNGHFTKLLSNAGFDAVGMDASGKAIENARKLHPELKFFHGAVDRGSWPFEDAGFDAVLATEVIEHVYDVRHAFSEMRRIVRPGGYIILTTPYHGLLKNLLITLTAFEKHFAVYADHIRFFTNKSLAKTLNDHGFKPFLWFYIGRVRWLSKSVLVISQKS